VISHVSGIARKGKIPDFGGEAADQLQPEEALPGMPLPTERIPPAPQPQVSADQLLNPPVTETIATEETSGHDGGMAVRHSPETVDWRDQEDGAGPPTSIFEDAPVAQERLPTSFEQILPEATSIASADQPLGQRWSSRSNLGVPPQRLAYYDLTYLIDAVETAQSHWRPPRLHSHHLKQTAFKISVREGLTKYKEKAEQVIQAELNQLCDKGVFTGVHWEELSYAQRRKIIRSSLFLKEKFHSDGTFDKLKARLVAGGDMQDRTLYPDVSSPTVATQAVFIVAGIAADEQRTVVTMDIGGAYLNGILKEEVLMGLNKTVSELLIKCQPQYKKFLRPDGTCVVKLRKALYGCVESGKLWNEEICRQLTSMGYTANPYEECIFNKMVRGKQLTLALYVDDIMATCEDAKALDEDIAALRKRYKEVTVKEGQQHSYLGMTFDFATKRKVRVTMRGYVDDMVDEYRVEGFASSPAADDLFHIDPDSPTLPPARLAEFHSGVAKVLYLAKRVRADCLCATMFLTTRVLCATEQDWSKLQRLFKYINATKTMGTVLQRTRTDTVRAQVDASFAVHADMKSHTGIWITLGFGGFYIRSTKQRLMTKSSTESELVGMSDAIPMVIWFRNFLAAQGYDLLPAVICQDNQSTIALAQKGKSTSDRTRHIDIRYFFIKDLIERKEIVVEYLKTEDMIADLLTKPLQGHKFRRLRGMALNWYE
jgi:hypothetical protein